jgi:hypothetical protein
MDSSGWLWMVRGFAKKLLLADTAAVFVDSVYASPADASGPAVLLATLLFAGQIYWDFSGYSDIAVGAAALLGVRLSRNFDHPYRADSLRDFWCRWHISLTRWFTDYVYIPLGGSRRGTARLAVNTMVVFLLSGLWHGAALHFVVWGGVHGALLLLEKALTPCGGKHKARAWTAVCLRHAYTFSLVCIAWVFFRAASVSDALLLLSRLPVDWSLSTLHTTLLSIGIQPVAELVFGGALPASAARDVVRSTVPAQRIGLLSFGIDCGRRVVFHTAHGHDQCLYLLPILTLPRKNCLQVCSAFLSPYRCS